MTPIRIPVLIRISFSASAVLRVLATVRARLRGPRWLLVMVILSGPALPAKAQILTPDTFNFGNWAVQTTSPAMTFTLGNTQTVPLIVDSISASGDFAESSNCPVAPKTLGAGASCQIEVTFAPTTVGTQTGTLTVVDNSPRSPQTAQLTGSGVPQVGLSSASITFANQVVGTTSTAQSETLKNNLATPLTISSISTSGDFAETSTCPLSPNPLAARSSCTISVTFTPTALGARTGTLTIQDSASGSPQTVSLAGTGISASTPIQHVVIIFQENRTPDNLFQDPVLISRGADIASSGMNSKGQTIPLGQIDLGTAGANPDNYDLEHTHRAFTLMCDLNSSTQECRMNGANLVGASCTHGAANCPPPTPQFKYVSPSDVAPYFQLAEQYTFADRMFQTNQGPSFPAHQFILAGTSAPAVGSSLFAAENPYGVSGATDNTGCTAPPAEYVVLIDPSGSESSRMYPCYEHPALTDLLDSANITWKYYAPSAGAIWTAPNAVEHICGPNMTPPNATECIGSDWVNHVVLNQTQVLSDIRHGELSTISWVIPSGRSSDHSNLSDGSGPSWVSAVVNAIGESKYWANTAIFIAWDDWGGWYDHVPPALIKDGTSWGSGYVYGFRVPMIVVSPYAKPAYISHVTHDFGSILKFIETNFNLPSLGYADLPADDLSDCFNYSQPPIPFRTITAPLNADYFLNDSRPPTDPDDD